MRLTQILYRQHIGFMFKKHWLVQGKRVPRDSGTEAMLKAQGIQVSQAVDVLKQPHLINIDDLPIPLLKRKSDVKDEFHPDYKTKAAYVLRDNNVLLEGLRQAQVLTKSVVICELPDQLEARRKDVKVSDKHDKAMRDAVLTSHLLDAEQEKLRKIKDPLRPAFVFPRVLGISDARKTKLILSKMLILCDRLSSPTTSSSRRSINNADFVVPLGINDDLVQFEMSTDNLIASKNPIKSFGDSVNVTVPNMTPLKSTISIPTSNFYNKLNHYPIAMKSTYSYPHTILHNFSPDYVKNLYEIEVTETQIEGRNLIKAFTVAAAKAQQLYGDNVKKLEQPIVVQSVETDGKSFYFGIFELRTLDLTSNDDVNIWYSIPKIDLFENCSYQKGRPSLEGYNSEVLKVLKSFYSNN